MAKTKKLPARGKPVGPMGRENQELRKLNQELSSKVDYYREALSVINIRDKALGHALSRYSDFPDHLSLREVCKQFEGFLIHGFDHELKSPSGEKGGDEQE